MQVSIEKRVHPSWKEGIVIADGNVELVVTADVGPNIIHCSLIGKPNMMRVFGRDAAPHGNTQWRPFGGHRLWHAPEAWESTYVRDDFEPQFTLRDDGLDAQQAVEAATGMQKSISITLQKDSGIKVVHTWRNCGVWPVRIAAWGISVLDAGGLLWAPQPRSKDALLPDRSVVLWPYARMNDRRVTWGAHSILVRQDPKAVSPFKFGMSMSEGIAAYFNHGQVLIKHFNIQSGAQYPDMGCPFEAYTNADMLELETLSPLMTLGAGETLEHTEVWRIFPSAGIPANEDAAEAAVREAIQK